MKIAILSCNFRWAEKQLVIAAHNLGHQTKLIHPRDVVISVTSGIADLGLLNNVDRVLIRRTIQERDAVSIICTVLGNRNVPAIEAYENYRGVSGSKIQSIMMRHMPDHAPATWAIWKSEQLELIRSQFSWPLLVKPDKGTCGHGIVLVNNFDDLMELARRHFERDQHNPFICQQKLERLREYRVLVLNSQAIAIVLKAVDSDKLVANAAAGTKFINARAGEIDPQEISGVENLAVEVTGIHGLIFAGVDILVDNNKRQYVLECNRNPQFKATQKAMPDIDIAAAVIKTLCSKKFRV